MSGWSAYHTPPKNPQKRPWTNPVASLPLVVSAPHEGKRTHPLPPLDAPHFSPRLMSSEMPSFSIAPRGESAFHSPRPALHGLDDPPPPTLPKGDFSWCGGMVVAASLVCICVLTPPFCSRSSATASTNEVTPIPGNLSIAATCATIDEAVLADLGDEDNDKDAGEYNYFGDMPNPDPKDDSPRDLCGDFVPLFAKSRKIAKDYSKDRKVRIFYDAHTVDQSMILGDSPPRAVMDIFKLWLGQVRNRAKWTLDRIAEAVFIISKHACDHQEMIVKWGGTKTKDEKVIALLLQYHTILKEISVANAACISQNKAVAMRLQNQSARLQTKSLPPNFRYDANKVCLVCMFTFLDLITQQ